MPDKMSFQEMFMKLQEFWSMRGYAILQAHSLEMESSILHPSNLNILGTNPRKAALIQPARKPQDSEYGKHPNRLQHHYQLQVIIKPSPGIEEIKSLYLESLSSVGISKSTYNISFNESKWEYSPIGASGKGYKVLCNDMEISHIQDVQKFCKIDCEEKVTRISYSLERIALFVQEKSLMKDLAWNRYSNELNSATQQNQQGQPNQSSKPSKSGQQMNYGEIDFEAERQYSAYNLKEANVDILLKSFDEAEKESARLIEKDLVLPAYDFCIKAISIYNLLEARTAIKEADKASYITRVGKLSNLVGQKWLKKELS